MTSKQMDGMQYERLDNQDHDNDNNNSLPNTSSSADANSAPLNSVSRSIIRRRRPEPRPSPIRAMSLVGLKNLFFKQTLIPVPVSTNSNHDYDIARTSPAPFPGPFDWSNVSRRPLLRPEDPSSQLLTSQSAPDPDLRLTASTDSDNTDVESQSTYSRTEKATQKKGFRIDARVISDATIGLSDGLTVPFALTAGLSALGNTKVVIYGGFAELIAGAISMGLGGYLGAKGEA